MSFRVIRAIAGQELTVSIRNKWSGIFATLFCLLIVGVSYAGVVMEGFAGMESFTRTSASILNLVLYIIPLLALAMGTLSLSGDRGAAQLLFSQPVARSDVLIGKLLGLFVSICLSTLAGFAVAGLVIAYANGFEGLWRFTALVGLSLLLALVFLALAGLVVMLTKRGGSSFGYALFVWFFFVLFYDLIVLSGALMLSGKASKLLIFYSLFGNPVDMVRVAALIILDNETIFGAAGAALLRFWGGATAASLLLIAGLVAWTIFPLLLSIRVIRTQDI